MRPYQSILTNLSYFIKNKVDFEDGLGRVVAVVFLYGPLIQDL
jgi:hypothetical protein